MDPEMQNPQKSIQPFAAQLSDALPAASDISAIIAGIPPDFKGDAADAIVAAGATDRLAVDHALARHREDLIRSMEIFDSLPPGMVDEIVASSMTLLYPADTVVFLHGSAGDGYFIIASGSAQVYHQLEDGTPIILATLMPGEGFGEMALLTGEARSASVRASERSCYIFVPKHAFDRSIAAYSEISRMFIKVLAKRLSVSNESLLVAAETEHAFRQFLTESMAKRKPALIGDSPVTRKLRSAVSEAAENRKPVLISGEPGTEVWDIAALIHGPSSAAAGMLLKMDARCPGATEAPALKEKSDAIHLESAQETMLFGRRQGALPFAPERRFGFLQTAGRVTVLIENVEALVPEVQEKLADYIESGRFMPLGEQRPIASSARIIAATSSDPEALTREGGFSARLHGLLAAQHLTVPPLRQRKRDLTEISNYLIGQNSSEMGKRIEGIDDEAHKAIMAYNWPGNIEELNVVLRRAVNIARSEQLTVDDVFISPPPVTGKLTFNLLKLEPVQKIFQSGKYPLLLQLIVGPMFLMIVLLGLFGPQDPDRNVALPLTWGLWEPMLFIGTFFVARFWCSVCPIGAVSALVGRTTGMWKKVPNFIRNHGIWFTAAGIGVIFWAESAAGMMRSPRATAFLVLSILTLAVIVALVFQRRTWCRYLCPLGNMVGTLSSCSMVELRSNYGVCNNECTSHECFTGSEKQKGCQLFSAPFSLRSNLSCVMCGNCVKACPHNSPVLNLRIPGHELWAAQGTDRGLVFLAVALMGTQIFRGIDTAGHLNAFGGGAAHALLGLAAVITAMVVSGLFVRAAGMNIFGKREEGSPPGGHLLAYALLPLVACFEAGFQLRHILLIAGQTLTVAGKQIGIGTALPGFIAPSGLITTLQVITLMAGTLWSLILLRKYLRQQLAMAKSEKTGFFRAWPVLLLSALYLWLFLAA